MRGQTGPYAPRHTKLAFDEFEHGFVYRRVTEDTDENDLLWTIGRTCLWPNALYTGDHFEWRVPIDDENMLSVTWHFARVPKEQEPYEQGTIPTWHGPIKDELTGKWITTHVMNQDFVAWLGQGKISDRWNEHLGSSDRGVIMVRKRFLDDLERVARGEDPKAIVRDPQANECVALPVANRRSLVEGLTRAELDAHPFAGFAPLPVPSRPTRRCPPRLRRSDGLHEPAAAGRNRPRPTRLSRRHRRARQSEGLSAGGGLFDALALGVGEG